MQKEIVELKSERDMLFEENHRLKEMIRQLEEENMPQCQDGGAETTAVDQNSNLQTQSTQSSLKQKHNNDIKNLDLVEEYV